MRNVIWRLMASASAMIIFPALGLAQFGSIAGVVKDNSGAILPNVTVEASSPVLIEKSRTAVSDASGQYRIDQLRPGTYTVTFTRPASVRSGKKASKFPKASRRRSTPL